MSVKLVVNGEEQEIDESISSVSIRTLRGEKASFRLTPEEQTITIEFTGLHDGGYPDLDVVEAVRSRAQSEAREGKTAGNPVGDEVAERQRLATSVDADSDEGKERLSKLKEEQEETERAKKEADSSVGASTGETGVREPDFTGEEVASAPSPMSPASTQTAPKGRDAGNTGSGVNTDVGLDLNLTD